MYEDKSLTDIQREIVRMGILADADARAHIVFQGEPHLRRLCGERHRRLCTIADQRGDHVAPLAGLRATELWRVMHGGDQDRARLAGDLLRMRLREVDRHALHYRRRYGVPGALWTGEA